MNNKTCPRCQITCSTNANFAYHMKRKRPCTPKEINAIISFKKFKCERCESTFQTKQNLNSHLIKKKQCEIKDPTPEEIELRLLFDQLKEEHLQQREEYLKENKHLKMEIDHLKMQSNTTTNNNNNNIQTNNVTINVYGKEDISHITDSMLISCFRDFDKSIEKYFGMKHFSILMRSNHNLYVSNMRDGYMMVFNSKKWNLVNREVTLRKMYYEIKEILSNEWDTMRNKNAVEPHIKSIYPRFIEYELDDEREEKFQTASCDKMACMAYNNRNFPMQMKKQIEKITEK